MASQLLDENTNQAAWRTHPNSALSATPSPVEFSGIPTSGAIATGVTALTLIWLVHWARASSRTHSVSKARAAVVLVAVVIVSLALYVYARRQLLLFLRHRAVEASTGLVASFQAFDAASSSAIQLIQEVEVVSRGYGLSVPLPPVTRMEQSSSTRRCIRLRKSLRSAFASTLPALAAACQSLQSSVDEDDLERYLDVYDVNNGDVQQATAGYREDEFEDLEGLKAIRNHQHRFTTFRRLFLCSLLSLGADGSGLDFARWRTAGESIQQLLECIAEASDKIVRILSEEDSFGIMSPISPGSVSPIPGAQPAMTPTRQRLREQFRKLATLSTGIRSLQAKMQVLREESQLALSTPSGSSTSTITFLDGRTDNIDTATDDDMQLVELGNSLLAHYDAIGSDLKSLVNAWDSGRTGLTLSLERAERRVSRASGVSTSTGLRSPAISLGGLTAVEEVLGVGVGGGTPDDALKALEGDSTAPDRAASGVGGSTSPLLRARSPRNLRISTSDISDAADSGLGMDEVFEAVAAPPKPRALGTPQERAARITEERRRMAAARERRDASTQMIRELESVISAGGAPGTEANRRASYFDRRQSSATATSATLSPTFGRRESYDFGGKFGHHSSHSGGLSPLPLPISPAPSSASSNGSGGAVQQNGNGYMGRRRPFSMYRIGSDVVNGNAGRMRSGSANANGFPGL